MRVEEEFGADLGAFRASKGFDRIKQALGKMVKAVLESLGYEIDQSGVMRSALTALKDCDPPDTYITPSTILDGRMLIRPLSDPILQAECCTAVPAVPLPWFMEPGAVSQAAARSAPTLRTRAASRSATSAVGFSIAATPPIPAR